MPKETVSPWQYFSLSSIYLLGIATLLLPVGPAGQDGWLAVLLASGVAAGLSLVWTAVVTETPGGDLYACILKLLGTGMGSAVGLAYAGYFSLLGAMALRAIADLYVTAVMPRTPMVVFAVVLAALAVWLVCSGIEAIARLAELLLLPVVFVIAVLNLLSVLTPNLTRFERLLPMLEWGWFPLLKGSLIGLGFPFGETVGLAGLASALSSPRAARGVLPAAIAFVGLALSLVTVVNIAALGPEELVRVAYPSLVVTQQISLADFVERIEVLIIFVWTFGAFIRIAASLYLVTLGLANLFSTGNHRAFVPPVATLLLALCVGLWDSSTELLNFIRGPYLFLALPFQVFLPVLLLAVARVRCPKKPAKNSNPSTCR
ncbi:MAG: GerAB/ArcD/ProY family transporter [Moorellales bacterium]